MLEAARMRSGTATMYPSHPNLGSSMTAMTRTIIQATIAVPPPKQVVAIITLAPAYDTSVDLSRNKRVYHVIVVESVSPQTILAAATYIRPQISHETVS